MLRTRYSAVAAARRAFASSAPGPLAGSSQKPAADAVEALASTTPGITRLRKGGKSRAVEVDSTIARIMGSDWGDRRHQSVSLPMRLYWIVFGVVLANGAYTYVSGKDEMYLVDKVQQKVDEKLGVVETNEFVVMAADARPPAAAPSEPSVKPASAAAGENRAGGATAVTAPRASVLSSSASGSAPFFHPSAAPAASAARPKSKADLQAQLLQLRAKQQLLRQELQGGTSFRDVDDVALEIRLLDEQKAQLKRMIKRL